MIAEIVLIEGLNTGWMTDLLVALGFSLRSLLIAGIGMGALLLLRQCSASVQHFVCKATLLTLLCSVLVAVLSPKQWVVIERTAEPAPSEEVKAGRGAAEMIVDLPPPVIVQELAEISIARTSGQIVAPSRLEASQSWEIESSRWQRQQWRAAFLWVSIPGVMVSLALMGVSHLICRLRLFSAKRIDDPRVIGAFRKVAERLSLGPARVKIFSSPRCSVPVAVGWLFPKVVLPTDAADWDDARLRSALLHELAHLKRRDFLWQTLGRLACALHWWNPLSWMLFARMRNQAEEACDNLVIASTAEPENYAEDLVAIAKQFRSRFFASAEVGMLAKPKLGKRIEAILNPSVRRGTVGSTAAALGVGLIVVGATSAAFSFAMLPGAPTLTPDQTAMCLGALNAIKRAEAEFPALVYSGETELDHWDEETESWDVRGEPKRFEVRVTAGRDPENLQFRLDERAKRRRGSKTKWSDGKRFFTARGIDPDVSTSHSESDDLLWERGRLFLLKDTVHHHDDVGQKSQLVPGAVRRCLLSALERPLFDGPVTVEATELNGVSVVKLVSQRSNSRNTWWLDPARNYAMLASLAERESHGRRNQSHRIDVEAFKILPGRFWFPERVKFSQINGGVPAYQGVTRLREVTVAPDGFPAGIFDEAAVLASLRSEKSGAVPAAQAEALKPPRLPATLTVYIKDAESGEGLPGITAWFDRDGERSKQTSDALGRFVVDLSQVKQPVNFMRVWASEKGYVGTSKRLLRDKATQAYPAEFTLLLQKGRKISGRVLDEEGKGIEAAKVELSFRGISSWNQHAITDGEGRWSYPAAPANVDEVFVRLSHSKFTQDTVYYNFTERSNQPIETIYDGSATFEMAAGGKVFGTVTDSSGQAIAGAELILGQDRWGANYPTATSDEDGRYEMSNVALTSRLGEHFVTLQADGYSPEVVSLGRAIVAGGNQLNFTLKPSSHLRGRLIDEAGEPVRNALVVVERWRGVRALAFETRSDADGRFEWDSAPADVVTYSILRGEVELRRLPLVATGIEQLIIHRPALIFSGEVVDARLQKPIPRFQVILGRKVDADDQIVWQDEPVLDAADGKFSISADTVNFRYLVRIEAEGYRPQISDEFVAEMKTVPLKIALRR